MVIRRDRRMTCLSEYHVSMASSLGAICFVAFSISLSAADGQTTAAHGHAGCTDSSHAHGHADHVDHARSHADHADHAHGSNGKNESGVTHAQKSTGPPITPMPTMSPQEIKQKLEDLLIVPDIIPVAPKERVDVWFAMETAEFGNIIHEDVVSKQPILLMWRWNPGEFFTVIATGPDVPSTELPTDAEWRHWIVINIPGNEIHKGQTLRDYEGFGNETKLGFHRMAFLVFKQPQPYMKSDEAKLRHSGSYRGFFSTRNFIKMHDLGVPVAANFIVVNCTNMIHNAKAMQAAMMASTTTTTVHADTGPNKTETGTPTTTIGYEYTAYAEHDDTDEKKHDKAPNT